MADRTGKRWDRRRWKRLIKDMEALSTMEVRVGILQDQGGSDDHGGITVAEIAAIHEFGAPNAGIPQRSFIRSGVEKGESELSALAVAMVTRIMKIERGTRVPTAKQALNRIGAKAVSLIRRGITRGPGIPPPLAEATVARKGSARPLVDTGQLLAAISWKVEVRA